LSGGRCGRLRRLRVVQFEPDPIIDAAPESFALEPVDIMARDGLGQLLRVEFGRTKDGER
jgi:hypothetical protein